MGVKFQKKHYVIMNGHSYGLYKFTVNLLENQLHDFKSKFQQHQKCFRIGTSYTAVYILRVMSHRLNPDDGALSSIYIEVCVVFSVHI